MEYAWKPVVCKHCNVFGHSVNLCKARPKTAVEVEVEKNKQVRQNDVVKEGFVEVRSRNYRGAVGVQNGGGYQHRNIVTTENRYKQNVKMNNKSNNVKYVVKTRKVMMVVIKQNRASTIIAIMGNHQAWKRYGM